MAALKALSHRSEIGRRVNAWLLVMPALAVLAGILLVPLLVVITQSFTMPQPGLQNYRWFFGTEVNLVVLLRTFKIAFLVTIFSVIVAYPYAFAMSVAQRKLRIVLILCVLVPFWVSGIVRTFAWVILLQNSGPINQFLQWVGIGSVQLIRTQLGVTIGMVQILLPFMIMPLYSVMRGVDLRLLTAAGSLGATPFRSFWQIYLPLTLPGVYAGATIVFILSLGFYITPLLLGGPSSTMLSTLIQQQVLSLLSWGQGGAMSVVLLVATFLVLIAAAPFMKRSYTVSGSGK
ncbi:ABC transporter permease [Aliihoeflea sp. PC F10.4]